MSKKNYVKLNNNNRHLSLGNLFRILKEETNNKNFTIQSEIFCILFDIDSISDTTVNNYCTGVRAINSNYKNIYVNWRQQYAKDETIFKNIILNIIATIDNKNVFITKDYFNQSIDVINSNTKFNKVCLRLYNISKNDIEVTKEFSSQLKRLLDSKNLYKFFVEVLFFVVLDKKQPIYIEDKFMDTLDDFLYSSEVSSDDAIDFVTVQLKGGLWSIRGIHELAKKGNPYACFEMGYMEYKGEITGIPRYNKAYEYFLISSLNNHPRACLLIGEMLLTNKIGNGSEEDKLVALKYLTKASELGSVAALNKLGLYYLNIDKSKAIEYFNKAIKEDYVYSYNNLGKIYEDMKDYKKAFDYYMKSALKEESWACNKLGEFYRKGIYVEKNMKLAFDYYNLSTNVPVYLLEYYSKYNLAKYFYQCGNYELGIEKDIEKAITLYDESSNHDVIESSIELLNIYIDKYLENKNKDNLLKVNYYKDKILNSRKYNNEICAKIEKILSKIEVNNEKNIYN